MSTTNVPSIYVIIQKDDKIAFLLRTNTGFKDNTYTLPAGHVEANENYRAAALREALEEVGAVIVEDDLRHVYTMQRRDTKDIRVDIFFRAENWGGELFNVETHKHGELAWFAANDLPHDKIMDFQSSALAAIFRGETYGELGW